MKHAYKYAVASCFILITTFVKSQVVVNFAADDTIVCPGVPVTFSDVSTIPGGYSISSYEWSFAGGFASTTTSASPIVYYYTPGVYTVSLTITVPGYGTFSSTATDYIVIVNPSEASFTYSVPDICSPYGVTFSNTSTAGDASITSYLWDFDDGTFSSAENPVKTFTSAGTYDVILFITDGNGCSDNYSVPVTVTPPLTSSLSVTGSTYSCGVSTTPTVSAATTGGTTPYSYSWDYGNGTTGTAASSPVTYTDCGTYDITYTVTDYNGCSVTNSNPDTITIVCYVADFSMSDDTICEGTEVLFTNLSDTGAVSYYWQFNYPSSSTTSTEESPSFLYTTSGTKHIKLTVTWPDGCTAQHFDTITLVEKPDIGGIAATDSISCDVPFTTTLSFYDITGTGPFSYTWTVDGTTYTEESPTITFTIAANYDVTLVVTDSNGCSASITMPGFIKIKKPTIDILATPLAGCAPLEVTFSNSSSSTYVPLDYFVWDYDDGTVDTLYTTGDHTHVFTSAGNYHVTMTLYTTEGCPKTEAVNIDVGNPLAYFVFDEATEPACNPIFIDNLSGGASDFGSVSWGDGFTSTLDPPHDDTMHVYAALDTATYLVTLTIEDNGCTSTYSDSITVLPSPVLSINTVLCDSPYTAEISIDSTIIFGDFCLNFNDTDTLCYENPVIFNFGAAGEYEVEIIPFDSVAESECPQSLIFYVVIPELIASYTASASVLCDTGTVYFESTTDIINTTVLSYDWQVGPGVSTGITYSSSSLSTSFSYDFTTSDIYPVTLTVHDVFGCTSSYTDTVAVGATTAYFTVDSIIGCSPKQVYLSDSSYAASPDGFIASWTWEYDGVHPDYVGEFPPVEDFPNGVWDITLTVTDNIGCVDSYVQTFDFSNVLTAGFLSDSLTCDPGEFLHFENTTSGVYSFFEWDFGDGTLDTTSVDGEHLYATEGFYTVTLTVGDTLGCINSYADSFYVQFDSLVADFDLNYLTVASCPPLPVQLINTSTGDISDFYWEVERESGTFTYYPDTLLFTYTLPGDYDVYMIASSPHGCVDTMYAENIINIPGPTGTMTFSPLTGCLPVEANFTITDLTADLAYIDLGDGDTVLITGDYTYTYTTEGEYFPSLILIDSTGCFYSQVSDSPIVTSASPIADFSVSDSSVCLGDSIMIIDLSSTAGTTPADSFILDFGDGTINTYTSGFDTIFYTYADTGTYSITLTESNAECADTSVQTIFVNTYPSATLTYTPVEGCFPLTVDFILSGVSASDVLLNFGDSVSASITNDTTYAYTYTAAGSFVPSFTLNSASGCTLPVTGTDTIDVYNVPEVNILLSDTDICAGTDIIIYNTSSTPVFSPPVNYTIDFGDGSSITTSVFDSITHTYSTAGLHLVTAIADNGFCTDSVSVNLNVNDIPTALMSYSPLAGCYDLAVDFSFSDVSADTININFGDGNSAYISGDTTYTYTVAGSYLPTVTLSNASGCSEAISGTDTVFVFDVPLASVLLNDSAICEGASIILYNTDTTVYALPVNYTIDFGDGTITTLADFDSVEHVYTTDVAYTITCTTENGYCADTATVNVLVNDVPSATMEYDPLLGCENLTVDFSFTGLMADEMILYFGNGDSAFISGGISYDYLLPGKYVPQLKLNNFSGCNFQYEGDDTIFIHYSPLADFMLSDTLVCIGNEITVTNTSDDTAFSPILYYELDFGDGSPLYSGSTLTSEIHNYPAAGTYTIQLLANNAGCTDTVTKEIEIAPLPSAIVDVLPTVGCASVNTEFILSYVAADSIFIHTGTTTLLASGSTNFLYDVPGVYYPSIDLINTTGCVTNFSVDSIIVSYEPAANFIVTDSMPYCSGEEIFVINNSTDTVDNSVINPIDEMNVFVNASSIFSGVWFDSISYSFDMPGDYEIIMIATNQWGCTDTMLTNFTVHENPVAVAGADETICPGVPVALDATASSGGYYYSWSPVAYFDDASSATPSGTFVTTTEVTLVYANDYCSDADTVTINVLNDLDVTAWPDAEICVGEYVQLYSNYNSEGGDVQVLWLQGDYLNSTLIPDPISTPLNTITYTVQAACGDLLDYADVTITVNPLPEVFIEDTVTMILNEPVSFTANATGSGTLSYAWSPFEYLNCYTCPTVTVDAPADMMYYVNVTDEKGCSATDSVYLRVVWNCAGDGIEVVNIITPNGDGINDRFQFRTEAVKELFYINIYNRWGEIMFSSNNPQETWDGSFNGEACDPGVYVYTMKGICFDDEEFMKSGNVTLVR